MPDKLNDAKRWPFQSSDHAPKTMREQLAAAAEALKGKSLKRGTSSAGSSVPPPHPNAGERSSIRSPDSASVRRAQLATRPHASGPTSEIDGPGTRIGSFSVQPDRVGGEYERLRNENEDLRRRLQIAEHRLTNISDKAAQIRETATKLESDRDALAKRERALAGAEKRLEQRHEKLTVNLRTYETDLRRFRDLDRREADIRDREGNAKSVERKLRRLEEDLSEQKRKVESESGRLARDGERHQETRRALREVRQESRELSAEAASTRRSAGGLKRRLEAATRNLERARGRVHDRPAFHIEDWGVVRWLLRDVEINSEVFGDKVAIEGNGPWQGGELRRQIAQKGFRVSKCGAKGAAGTLIVGRSGCSKRAIEQHVSNRDGEALYIFPQELFIASLLAGRNPFDEREDDDTHAVLEAFGKGHPVIEWLRSLQFPWPEIGFEDVPGGSDFEQVDVSPLVKLGYRVGMHKGLAEPDRHETLRDAFLKRLPFVESREYMEAWNEPGTRLRLRRIAWHIAMLVRAHSKIPGHDVAVDEWESDLDWLRRTYYRPMMRFVWP